MYNFNGTYIDPGEIIVVNMSRTDDPKYPYGLSVTLRNGNTWSTRYAIKRARDNEASRINYAVAAQRAETAGSDRLRAVERELAGARRDIRELKRLVRDQKDGR